MAKLLDDWKLILLSCLTLGLAPFTPEPHIWGKLKWVIGGAEGMLGADWFDLIMHGTPWVFLILFLIRRVLKKNVKATVTE